MSDISAAAESHGGYQLTRIENNFLFSPSGEEVTADAIKSIITAVRCLDSQSFVQLAELMFYHNSQ